MKSVLARLLLLIFPATLLLIVAGLLLTRQTAFSPVLLNIRDRDTLQGQVRLWDVSTGWLASIARYNRPDSLPNWAASSFSPDGWIAYQRGKTTPITIGVSDAIRWRPVEFLTAVPVGTENIRLTWLPSGHALLVSYTRDYRGLGLEAVIGRQFLNLNGGAEQAELVDWPFLCDELVVSAGEMMLRCPAQSRLRHGGSYPSAAFYVLSSGQWLTDAPASMRSLFPVNDLLNPNWTYSPQSGLAFFGTFFDGAPGGLNRVPVGSDQAVPLPLDLTRQPTLRWSPDGSRLLVQQADSRVWSVFDLAQNKEIARLQGEDIDVNIGYQWARDANHVAYVTLASGGKPETLHIRSFDRTEDATLPITDTSTYIAAIQP